jgi:glyoxylase-like metal-dependent hydrolase (beta-lactamase superfamily II)
MSSDILSDWFAVADLGQGVMRITEPNVHRFFRANMFLICGRDADLLIDFGMGLRPLEPLISHLGSGAPLIAVATHSHADHIGGFHEFIDRRAHISEALACAVMADSDTVADMFRALDEPVAIPPQPHWRKEEYRIVPAPLAATLQEGDVIDLGDRKFEVLHLPGHSPGCIGLVDWEHAAFFGGDAIYDGMLVDELPHSDKAAYRTTMARIAALEVAIAYGGHGSTLSKTKLHEIATNYFA